MGWLVGVVLGVAVGFGAPDVVERCGVEDGLVEGFVAEVFLAVEGVVGVGVGVGTSDEEEELGRGAAVDCSAVEVTEVTEVPAPAAAGEDGEVEAHPASKAAAAPIPSTGTILRMRGSLG